MTSRRRLIWPALCLAVAVVLAGCTRRQLAPGIVAGVGAAMTTSGGIYRATLDTSEPFGDNPGEVAGTTILIFGGLGLLLTGVIWSLTSSHCEENSDCWSHDVCELRTHTCIDGDAARRLRQRAHRNNQAETADETEGDDEGEAEAEDSDSDEAPAQTTPSGDDEEADQGSSEDESPSTTSDDEPSEDATDE